MKVSYIKELDGIRGISALMIMFFHFFIPIQTNGIFWSAVKKLSIFGQTGVTLFFVLSGFLITRILIKTKNAHNYFSNFYKRRALRIFPLYFLFLFIYYYVLPFVNNTAPVPFNLQVYNWFYLQNIAATFKLPYVEPGHLWSLAVEEHFYLFWPLLIYYVPTGNIKHLALSTIMLSLITRIILREFHLEVFYFTFARMDDLAIGALLAVLERRNKLTMQHSGKFVFLFCLMIIPNVLLWSYFKGEGNDLIQVFKFPLIYLTYFGLLGFVLSTESSVVRRFLTNRFLLYTGKISYGLYVFHPICYYIFFKKVLYLNLISSFGITYIAASLSYYLYEAQILKFKTRYDYKIIQHIPHVQ